MPQSTAYLLLLPKTRRNEEDSSWEFAELTASGSISKDRKMFICDRKERDPTE